MNNLNGCPFRVLIFPREPTAILLGSKFVGQDGAFVRVLAEKMNFTLTMEVSIGKRLTYGYANNSRTGDTFSGIVDGTIDLSANGHFLKDYEACGNLVQLTRPITSDRVCFLVPKANTVPPIATVLNSFQREVWLMIALTYVCLVTFYYAWAEVNNNYNNI